MPNAFTPNNDGINDIFLPRMQFCKLENYRLQVFDRWGQLIFETKNINEGWDGAFRNKSMNVGVYIYVINYKALQDAGGHEIRMIKGDLTLLK